MKTKIYKLLSVLLALAMILSTCVCAVSAEGDTAVWYQGVKFANLSLNASGVLGTSTRTDRVATPDFIALSECNSISVGENYTLTYYLYKSASEADGEFISKADVTAGSNGVSVFEPTLVTDVTATYVRFMIKNVEDDDIDLNALADIGLEVDVVREPKTITYYMSSAGDSAVNDGLSKEAPLGSLNAAIEKAKANGFGEGDVVYVKVIDTDDGNTSASTKWTEDGTNSLSEYAFKLHVSSNSTATKEFAAIGDYSDITLKGEIEFENIYIYNTTGENGVFDFGSNSVSFGKGCKWGATSGTLFVTTGYAADPTKDFDLYLAFNAIGKKQKAIVIGATATDNKGTFGPSEDKKVNVNVTVDHGAKGYFALGTLANKNYVTYNYANINFNLKNAADFDLTDYANHVDGYPVFTSNAAIQIINSTGNAALTDNVKAYLAGKTTNDTEPAPLNYFIIENPYQEYDMIKFTDTPGKFKINLAAAKFDSIALVSKADPNVKAEIDADGYITVTTPGEYRFEAKMEENTTNVYYLSPNGNNAYTGIESAPFRTLNAIIAAATKAGYDADDTVYVKVAYVDGASAIINDYNSTIASHSFKLNISSATKDIALIGNQGGLSLGGPIHIEKIKLNIGNGSGSVMFDIGNNDLSIGKSVTYSGNFDLAMRNSSTPGTFTKDMTLYFGSYLKDVFQSTWWAPTYNCDKTVIYDNGTNNKYNVTLNNKNGATKYNGNLNFVVNNATGLEIWAKFADLYQFAPGKAVTLINNNPAANITASVTFIKGMKDTETNPVPYYIYKNGTGSIKAMEVTNIPGKVKIVLNTDVYSDIALVKDDDDTVRATPDADGYITVPASGEYTLTATKQTGLSATYYVSPEGSDANDGKSQDTPLASVEAAINLANEAGYATGDTVAVKAIHVADKAVVWTEDASNKIPAHTFTLDLSSVSNRATIGTTKSALFNGPTIISNVLMGWGDGHPSIDLAGNDMVFGAGAVARNDAYNFFYAKSGTYDRDLHLTFNTGWAKTLYLGGDWCGPTFNKDVYVTFDAAGTYDLVVSTQNANHDSHATKINGVVNINIKNGSPKLTFTNNIQNAKYGENSAVQIINSAGAATAAWDTALSTNAEGAKPAKYYIINNKSNLSHRVSFTDTVGKYNVTFNSAWTTTITNAAGEPVDAAVVDGVLDLTALPSGTYNIEYTKVVETKTLYVSADGSDDNDGSETAPLASVAAAVKIAKNADFVKGDTLYVKATGDIAWGTLPNYGFTLDLNSADVNNIAKVSLSTLTGNLVIDNIQLGNTAPINLGGKNVTIGENVPMDSRASFDLAAGGQTIAESQTIIIKNAYTQSINVGNNSSGDATWNKDLNIIIDNPKAAPSISYKTFHGGIETINGNYNIIVKNADAITFADPTLAGGGGPTKLNATTVKGAVQVIVPAETTVTGKEFMTSAKFTGPVYFYTNKTGLANAIELTDTVGKVKVNIAPDRFELVENGEATEILEGYAEFPAGVYDLTVNLINPYNEIFYIKAGATNGDGKEATPFATVAEAIAAANKMGAVYGDNFTFKIVGTEAVEWGETEAFAFVPVVESANKEALSTLKANYALQGKADIDYVVLTSDLLEGGFTSILLNGNDIVLGENVQGSIQLVGTQKGAKYKKGQTVEINTAAVKRIYVGNTTQNNNSFDGDVNYILNNENLNPLISFMPYYGHKIDINGNFTVKVIAASSINFGSPIKEVDGNDVQPGSVNILGDTTGASLIVPADVEVGGIDNFKAISEYHYIIKTVRADVGFTEFASEYTIDFDEEIWNIAITDAENNEGTYNNDLIVLPNAGVWTVKLDCKEHVYDLPCDDTCDRCGEVDETRVHVFSTYAPNNDADCVNNATETAYCDYNCGEKDTREIANSATGHKYSNACDKTCNNANCPAPNRTVGAHKYDHAADKNCNICNAARTVADNLLIKQGTKSYYYYKGVKSTKTDLVKISGTWYYIENGVWAETVDTLHKINGKWFLIKKGIWKATTGLVQYKGKTFYVVGGKWNSSVNDLKKIN
ncbi:MAG: hypothetical protein IJD45_06765, partial [Clostridia bacterium]|nr:hypothetical protein [Clostridia bacterium]